MEGREERVNGKGYRGRVRGRRRGKEGEDGVYVADFCFARSVKTRNKPC